MSFDEKAEPCKQMPPNSNSIHSCTDSSNDKPQTQEVSIQVATAHMLPLNMFGFASHTGYMEWELNSPSSTYDPVGMFKYPNHIYAPEGWYEATLNIVFAQDSLTSSGQTDSNSWANWTLENGSGGEVFNLATHPAGYRETTLCRTERVYSSGESFCVRYNVENYTENSCYFNFVYGKCRWSFTKVNVA
jgi:hypothetical protein